MQLSLQATIPATCLWTLSSNFISLCCGAQNCTQDSRRAPVAGTTNGRFLLILVKPERTENISIVLCGYIEALLLFSIVPPAGRSVNVLEVCAETYLNLNFSQLCNKELHLTSWSEATLNSSHFQINIRNKNNILWICTHKISRKSAQFSLLPLPDNKNRTFYILQKLIHFRVQMAGTTTAVSKLHAKWTRKGFLAFTCHLNLQFQMLGFNTNIERVFIDLKDFISEHHFCS